MGIEDVKYTLLQFKITTLVYIFQQTVHNVYSSFKYRLGGEIHFHYFIELKYFNSSVSEEL